MKPTITRVKELATDRERIFTNHISGKGLASLGVQPEPDNLACFHTQTTEAMLGQQLSCDRMP